MDSLSSTPVSYTHLPGTWGEEARYVWLRKEKIMEIHGGKTMLTFLDSNKDYKLYDEQNRVVTTQKGTELYTHYDLSLIHIYVSQ